MIPAKKCFAALLCWLICTAVAEARIAPESKEHAVVANLSVFRENVGQVRDQYGRPRKDIHFQLSGNNTSIFLSAGRLHYQWNLIEGDDALRDSSDANKTSASKVNSYRLDMELLGANKNAKPLVQDAVPDKDIYYRSGLDGASAGSCRKITYSNIYPNIDWVLYVKGNVLKYDFVIHKGGKVTDINIQYDGASRIALENGAAVITTPMGTLIEKEPLSFRQSDTTIVPSNFVLNDNRLGFQTAACDGVLIIDPELRLAWATYYGGAGAETGQYLMNTFQGYLAYSNAVATDNLGAVYMSGTTGSIDNIATIGAHQTLFSTPCDAFLVKFDSLGQRIWSTYFGGYSTNNGGTVSGRGHSIVCDTIGNVYMAGNTFCDSGIATVGAHQPLLNSNGYNWPDLYLVKFRNNGTRLWSTYYGNPGTDEGGSLAVKPDGSSVYLAGASQSYAPAIDAIASANAYVSPVAVGNAAYSGFLACFNAAGQRQWGTYIADASNIVSSVYDMDLDNQGNIYLTGYAIGDYAGTTYAIGSAGTYQPQYSGCVNSPFFPPSCMTDAFLQKWDANGNRLWGTYYGGDHPDGGYAVACDTAGSVYMTGFTSPFINANNGIYSVATQGSFLDICPTDGGAFLAKFSGSGQREWGTYYPGQGTALATNEGKVFLLSNTLAIGLATPCAYQIANPSVFTSGSSMTSMLSIFNASGTREYATYYGGKYSDWGFSLNVRKTFRGVQLYTAGNTLSPTDIATPGSFKTTLGGQLSIQRDAYLAKFIMARAIVIEVPCFSKDSTQLLATDTSLGTYLWSTGQITNNIWVKTSGMYTVTSQKANGCTITDSFVVSIHPLPVLSSIQGCVNEGAARMDVAAGNTQTYTYQWRDQSGQLLLEASGSTGSQISGLISGPYTCRLLSGNCDTTLSFTIENYPAVQLAITPDTIIAAGTSVQLFVSGADAYKWEPDLWLDNERSATPVSTPQSAITYKVTGYSQTGCTATAELSIGINEAVFIPNAFSPNGDGINDEFRIRNYGYLVLSQFSIFNRWGEEVFNTKNAANGWSGMHKGLPADAGVYNYYIRLEDPSGKAKVFKGTLTLIH